MGKNLPVVLLCALALFAAFPGCAPEPPPPPPEPAAPPPPPEPSPEQHYATIKGNLSTLFADGGMGRDAADAVVAGSKTRDEALAYAAAVGTQLGKMVTGLNTSTEGPRILYATLPDLGQSPLAVKAEAAFPGEGRAALLS